MTTITVGQARPGDVVLDSSSPRQCWQRGDEFYNWSTFAGPVMHFGPWEARYGPQGELTLLVRDGQPVSGA